MWLVSNIIVFINLPEAEKSKIKAPTNLISSEYPVPGSQVTAVSLFLHMVERMGEFCKATFIKA